MKTLLLCKYNTFVLCEYMECDIGRQLFKFRGEKYGKESQDRIE